MPSFIYKYSFTCIFFTVYAFPFINSYPVIDDNPYDGFIKFLSRNNCTMPKAIAVPFNNFSPSEPSNFSYLSTPLHECQTLDALDKNDEAYLLCKEIFDVLQNITCFEYNLPAKIETNNLSENVCKDFSKMQYVLPKRNDYLSAKLVDGIICRLMCTKEKYKLLCETLLWTYEALEKIKSANTLQDEKNKIDVDAASQDKGANTLQDEKNKIDVDAASQDIAPSTNVGDLPGDKSKADTIKDPEIDVNRKESDKPGASVVDVQTQEDNPEVEQNSNNGEVPKAEISKVLDQIPQVKFDTETSLKSGNSSTTLTETETGSKMSSPLKNVATTKAAKSGADTENFNVIQNDSNKEHVEPAKKGVLADLNIQDEHHVNQENDINVDEQPIKGKVTDEAQQILNTNNLLTTSGKTTPQQDKSATNGVLKNTKMGEVTLNNNGSSKATTKSEETVTPDMKNELSNVNLQEDENKVTVPKNEKDDKQAEKPKLTDFGVQGETTSTTNLPLLKSTPQLLPDDEEQHQENKDQEQYNDTENEGDYPKPDYDNAFNPPPKDKESDVKGSIIVSSQISNNYDTFNPRSSIGRIPEDIPMIPSFPEQEDSHFFFYFLSIVLIFMAGYLIFHNKQKIIALIVEGRHERRRRCHGVGYKKLETK